MTRKLRPVEWADKVDVVRCKHGSVYIRLLDETGDVFAVASMKRDVAVDFAGDLCSCIEGEERVTIPCDDAPAVH